jgi:hypothetical protein
LPQVLVSVLVLVPVLALVLVLAPVVQEQALNLFPM